MKKSQTAINIYAPVYNIPSQDIKGDSIKKSANKDLCFNAIFIDFQTPC